MRIRTSLLLSALLLGSLLLGSAAAQPTLAPPSGPVPADPYAQPGEYRTGPGGTGAGHQRMGQRHGKAQRAGQGQRRMKPRLRAALIARFDHDGDGRLTGRERAQAKEFVKRQRAARRAERPTER